MKSTRLIALSHVTSKPTTPAVAALPGTSSISRYDGHRGQTSLLCEVLGSPFHPSHFLNSGTFKESQREFQIP